MKKIVICILSLVLLLSLSGCTKEEEKEIFEVKQYVAHGIDCFKYDGIEYPAVFGMPEMSSKDMESLINEDDFNIVRKSINNVVDCFRYLKPHSIKPGEDDDYATILKSGKCTPRGICNLLLYLAGENYEEAGRIDLYADNDFYAYVCLKVDGIYYLLDPFHLTTENGWYSYLKEGIPTSGKTPEELIENILAARKNENFSRSEYLPVFRNTTSAIES